MKQKRGSLSVPFTVTYYADHIDLLIKHVNEGKVTLKIGTGKKGLKIIKIEEMPPLLELLRLYTTLYTHSSLFSSRWRLKKEITAGETLIIGVKPKVKKT